jgi:uncharacterized protein YciI
MPKLLRRLATPADAVRSPDREIPGLDPACGKSCRLRVMHYLLLYEFGPNYIERRAPYRDRHLQAAWAAEARGELVLAGAYADPVDGAVLLFQSDSPDVVERFAASDPYVIAGLVTRWRIRAWTTVVGKGAQTPVRPSG